MAHQFIPLAPGQPGVETTGKPNTGALPPGQPGLAAVKEFQGLGPGVAHPAGQAGHTPQVTVQREGERITRIQITCSCDQVIELECVY